MFSLPFTLTHQLRVSALGASRFPLRHHAPNLNSLASTSRTSASYSTLRLGAHPRLLPARNSCKIIGATSLGLVGLSYLASQHEIHCDATPLERVAPLPSIGEDAVPPPPKSSVNAYELTFGTVCGICAGVFVKKGAKALAFVFGGVFVLLQYFGSLNLVHMDWGRVASRFENLFYTKDAQGVKRAPRVGSLIYWAIDFLTANFQQRASFIAGFALGLRVG